MREPNSGALRSRWTQAAPPGKSATRGPGRGPAKDNAKGSSVGTYTIAAGRGLVGGSCGRTGRVTSTWLLLAGRVDMATCRAVPLGRAPVIAPSISGSRPSSISGSSLPRETNGAGRPLLPGQGITIWDNGRNPVSVPCACCGVTFESKRRPSRHRPRSLCPKCRELPRAQRNRASQQHAVAG